MIEFGEDCLGARHPFIAHKAHRAGTNKFSHLLEGISSRQTLRHHERHRRVVLAERQQHLGIGRLQAPTEGTVINRHQFFLDRTDHLAHAITHRPAIEARHAIRRGHFRAVMPHQAFTQLEGPDLAVRRYFFAFDHLALGFQLVVKAVKRVPDQGGSIAHHILRAPDRVEVGQIGLRHKAQRARGSPLRQRRGGKPARASQRRNAGGCLEKISTIHRPSPILVQGSPVCP